MDIIHLLPDSVANQIAAGEVVQRPASVVKELLENSIDAGATSVQVMLRESGRDMIQVIDNGSGMSPTDARMAFERHATSKIDKAADLFALRTMGFRGEALASIAAVAEVELRTRRPDDETGVLIRLSGSRMLAQETVACPAGANFVVRNIFFNVPARRKFLKSAQTELSNVINEVQHVALANPHVAITLSNNDTILFSLPAGSHHQRISQLFAKTIGQQLLPISIDNDLLSISGFVGLPEGARKRGALQYFFVNDRYMRHPYFHKAVMECYEGLLPDGLQPNYFIYLKVEPSTIDVNIHPTKTEIKFENEPARWHILMATVREALGKYNAVPAIDFDTTDAPDIPVSAVTMESLPSGIGRGGSPDSSPREPRPQFDAHYDPFRRNPALDHWEKLYADFANDGTGVLNARTDAGSAESGVLLSRLDNAEHHPVLALPADDATPVRQYVQVAHRYIAASERHGLMLIDQRRAHVCVLFAQNIAQMSHRQGLAQHELFPERVDIPLQEVPHLEAIMPELRYLGFELDSLGGGAYAVNGKPAHLGSNVELHSLLMQMVEAVREEVHGIADSLEHRLAHRLALAQAIPSDKVLSDAEMSQLVDSLLALPDHERTPDGKTVIIHLSAEDIASRFK